MMENRRQTAVSWFNQEILDLLIKLEKCEISNIDYIKAYNKTFNQAKQMEKQELESCYNHGSFSIIEHGHGDTFNEYYNETFKP